jgi:hypothetical protein
MGFDDPTLFGPVVGSVASCLPESSAGNGRKQDSSVDD